MKNVLVWIVLMLWFSKGYSQWTISADPVGGTPINARSYTGIKGSPYLLPEWAKGYVILDGNRYDKDLLYDMLEDRLVFKSDNGTTMGFNSPVSEFGVEDSALDKVRVFRKADISGYFEILVDGEFPLLKRTVKSLVEEAASFGKVDKINNVLVSSAYYTMVDGQSLKLKPTTKSLSAVLSGHNVGQYQKEHALNFKLEEDLIKLFELVNTNN